METQNPTWRQSLAQAFTNMAELCDYLQLDSSKLPLLTDLKSFPLRVPRGFAACMTPGDPADPLLRQVLLSSDELLDAPGYSADPVGDLAAVAVPGVIHKYHGRVLLIATGACAVHCRYCFRRNFPYADLQLTGQRLQQAINYIAQRPDITEVILSGGDPLMLNDDKLAQILHQLDAIPHLQRIRIHSRTPIVLPERVSPELLTIFAALRKPLVLVLHANHPHEISTAVAAACAALRRHQITLLNQSVLLQGVNNSSPVLCALSERLFACGVLPYYLHMLDQAHGAAHFAVALPEALRLMDLLRSHLPGYLTPQLVREQAGAAYKIAIPLPETHN